MTITFEKILTLNEQNKFSSDVISELNFKELIKSQKNNFDINYEIKELLINCRIEDIQVLIYFLFNNPGNNEKIDKNSISEKIYKN